MKRTTVILKWTFAVLAALVILLVFWKFVIPGVLLRIFFRERYPRWIGSAIALLIVVLFRFLNGGWSFSVPGESSGPWYFEVLVGGIAWVTGAFVIAAAYFVADCFVQGWKGGRNSTGPEAGLVPRRPR